MTRREVVGKKNFAAWSIDVNHPAIVREIPHFCFSLPAFLLGHHLTNDLHDDLDIRRQCRAINVRGNILFRKFHMCSVSVKLKLFNSYCASMHTPHLWWNYKKMSICKLQITYHNILKMNIGLSKFDSTSATCAITNTQCCQSVIRNLVGYINLFVDLISLKIQLWKRYSPPALYTLREYVPTGGGCFMFIACSILRED